MSALPPRHNLEDVSREFLHADLSLALTLARMAEQSYTMYGDCARGDRLAATVRKAAREIAHFLFIMESRAWDVTDLRRRYRSLQAIIAGLHTVM